MSMKLFLLLKKVRSSEHDLDLWSQITLLNQTFSKTTDSLPQDQCFTTWAGQQSVPSGKSGEDSEHADSFKTTSFVKIQQRDKRITYLPLVICERRLEISQKCYASLRSATRKHEEQDICLQQEPKESFKHDHNWFVERMYSAQSVVKAERYGLDMTQNMWRKK